MISIILRPFMTIKMPQKKRKQKAEKKKSNKIKAKKKAKKRFKNEFFKNMQHGHIWAWKRRVLFFTCINWCFFSEKTKRLRELRAMKKGGPDKTNSPKKILF
jgi:hypothetical protein